MFRCGFSLLYLSSFLHYSHNSKIVIRSDRSNNMRFYIRFYPHHYMQPQCTLSAARAPSTRHHATSELQKTRRNLRNYIIRSKFYTISTTL